MGFLFKTSLIHVKKNLPIVSVLGFFVGAGTTVLSSSNHLLEGLDQGFKEINKDSNPHDLVLVGTNFKQNQELNVKPSYDIELSNINVTYDYHYRWAFNSNFDHDYVKKGKKSELDSGNSSTSNNISDSSAEEALETLPKSILIVPTSSEDLIFRNNILLCISAKSFVNVLDKRVEFQDRNKATFLHSDHPWNTTRIFKSEFSREKAIIAHCPSGYITSHYLYNFSQYFWGIYKVFNRDIVGGTRDNYANKNDATVEKTPEEKLTEQEKYAIHRRRSFNPKRVYKRKAATDKNIYAFRPLMEEDYVLSFKIPFRNLLGSKDLSRKFKELTEHMRNSRIFNKLDETTRQSIVFYSGSKIFEEIDVDFYISSLEENFELFRGWVPMVPGMSYEETIIMLEKLFVWWMLNKIDSYSKDKKGFPIDNEIKWSDSLRDEFSSIVNSWDENTKGISNWEPYKAIIGKPNKFEKSEDYIFSTIRADKKIEDLKTDKHFREFEDKGKSGGGDESDKYCGGNGSSSSFKCKNFKITKGDTIIKRWKEILKNWIWDNYHGFDKENTSTENKENDLTKKKELEDPIFLPSFAKDSFANWNSSSKNKNDKAFDHLNNSFRYYRPYPTPFKNLFWSLRSWFFNSLKNYLVFLRVKALKEVNQFIAEHNIFTLSFLLYNFQYEPSFDIRNRYFKDRVFTKVSSKKPPRKNKQEDLSLSINYHKSLVVANTGKTSSKLNEPQRLNHTFKVITQESRDGSKINIPKLLSGNPLFKAKTNYEELIKRISIWNQDTTYSYERISYEYKDVFRMLSRARYTNPQYSKLFKDHYKYLIHNDSDVWNLNVFFSFDELKSLLNYVSQLLASSKDVKKTGSRIIFEFQDWSVINYLSTIPISHKLNTVWSTGYLDQFTSFFALISPFYAKKNNIKPISDSEYRRFKELLENEDLTQEEWEEEYSAFVLNPANHDHIVNINGNKLIIVGTALSPDMLLPSQSWLNLVPNKEKEALIYVDEFGYRNIYEKSLSTWNEFYISLTQPQIVKDLGIEEDYNKKLNEYMEDFLVGDGKKDFELRKVSDTNLKSLVFLRSNYVENFMSSVRVLSLTLLALMGSVILFTVWILIKKYITSSLNTFGVFIANGISKISIVLNSFSFILIPSLFGIVVGYFCSLGLQPLIFSLFSDIWYLSPVFNGFQLNNFIYYILLISTILGTISFTSSAWMLRSGVGDLMKINMKFKHSRLTKFVYDKLKNLSSLWKFRASVILNTLSRGLVLASSTIFLFVFSSFLFNNLGQFQNVSNLEITTRDYGFDIALNSPTDQSDQYLLTSYKNLGDTFNNNIPNKKSVFVKGKDKNGNEFWDRETIEFGPNNPELIATGINSPIHPKDLVSYLNACSDRKIGDLYKEINVLNTDNPSNWFSDNSYSLFLFKSTLEKKKDVSNNCPSRITDSYEIKEFKLPEPSHKSLKIFSSSDDSNTKNSKFTPNLDDENVKASLDLSDYVPVKNEVWKKTNGDNSIKEKEMEMYGNEPLFKPIIDYYKGKNPIISKETNTSKVDNQDLTSWSFIGKPSKNTNEDVDGDFRKIGNNYHPTLSRLFKDHSNYWLFSYTDLENVHRDPTFFKYKVIVPFLFNHTWTFTIFDKTISVNPWTEFNAFFSKYSPEVITAMEANYKAFVEAIIKSRYGAYFVNRFMSKHNNTNKDTEHVQGKEYSGKQSWKVTKEIVDEKNKNDIDEGIYWFDPAKIIFFFDKLKSSDEIGGESGSSSLKTDPKQPQRFILFRPDFLYLFYCVMKDPDFLKKR